MSGTITELMTAPVGALTPLPCFGWQAVHPLDPLVAMGTESSLVKIYNLKTFSVSFALRLLLLQRLNVSLAVVCAISMKRCCRKLVPRWPWTSRLVDTTLLLRRVRT